MIQEIDGNFETYLRPSKPKITEYQPAGGKFHELTTEWDNEWSHDRLWS